MPDYVITPDKCNHETTPMSIYLKKIEKHILSLNNQFHNSTVQWNDEAKSNFIITVLNGYLFPSIIVVQAMNNHEYVIDGTQRLSVCLDFKNNKFKIGHNIKRPIIKYQVTDKIIEFDLRDKFYKDLPDELQDDFNNYNIHIDCYSNCSNEDIIFHMQRYNIV